MCRLLGISVNRPTDFQHSLGAFRNLANSNRSGWGYALLQAGGPLTVYKSHLTALEDSHYNELGEARATAGLFHVRLTSDPDTPAGKDAAYSHPYVRNIRGQEAAFAHNGSWTPKATWISMASPEFQPDSARRLRRAFTDSEATWSFMASRLQGRLPQEWAGGHEAVTRILLDAIAEMRQAGGTGNLNFVLLLAGHLYAFEDNRRDGSYYRLHFVQRGNRDGRIPTEGQVGSLYAAKAERGERAFLVASEPQVQLGATTEEWKQVPPDTLLVARDGNLVWSSRPIGDASPAPVLPWAPLRSHADAAVLQAIRHAPHSLALQEVPAATGLTFPEAEDAVRFLEGQLQWIQRDARDADPAPTPQSGRFFTVPRMRQTIDEYLRSH